MGLPSPKEGVKLLSWVSVLEPLSDEELEDLNRRCPDIRLESEEDFYRPKEHDGGLFLIKKGRVRIYKLSPKGDQLTLAILHSGTVLTCERLRGLQAQARETSVVCFGGRENLERLIKRRPEVGLRLIDLLAERLRLSDARMSDVVYKEVSARLASLILELIWSEGVVTREGYRIPFHYTQEELATMIGARRVSVTRAFGQLQAEGAVVLKERRIHVRDIEALKLIGGRR
jgi:CRP/FNR family transcriptional regulator, cyclic AMP receptor protein